MSRLIMVLALLLVAGAAAAQTDTLDRTEIAAVVQGVVYIEAIAQGEVFASGSGTVVEPTGLIYTNRHVIEEADDFAIYFIEDFREQPVLRYYARIFKSFNAIDFAILQIDRDASGEPLNPTALNLPTIPVTDDEMTLGDPIYIFGFPDIGDGYLVLSQGNITTVENGSLNEQRMPIWYRTDAEMSSGNSGGLVVNSQGEFIGIPTWVRAADETLSQLGGILPYPAIDSILTYGDVIFGGRVRFTLVNASSETICTVLFSLTSNPSWGQDHLEAREAIEPGESHTFDATAELYDIRLLDCDDDELGDRYQVLFTDDIELTYPRDF